jgi:uncharacterized membrane protein YccC
MSSDERSEETEREDAELEEFDEGPAGVVAFLAGFVLGALLGAGAALLFAPERGTITRRRLGRRVRDLSADTADRVGELRHRAERELRRRRRRLARHVPGN